LDGEDAEAEAEEGDEGVAALDMIEGLEKKKRGRFRL